MLVIHRVRGNEEKTRSKGATEGKIEEKGEEKRDLLWFVSCSLRSCDETSRLSWQHYGMMQYVHREFTGAVTLAYLNARCKMNFQTISVGAHLSHARCVFIRTLKILRSGRLWERGSRPVRAIKMLCCVETRMYRTKNSTVVVAKLLYFFLCSTAPIKNP